LGREVATLVNESLEPGKYEVQWNATGYSSGIYFYSLSSEGGPGNISITKKMALIK
jgi:hypothetical protein